MKKIIMFFLISIFVASIPATSVRAKQPSQEKEIIALLSEVKYSDELIDTVHENEKVLKAISLFVRMIGRKKMTEDEMIMQLAHLFTRAGWTDWVPAVGIKQVKNKLYLVSIGYAFMTQSSSLYLFYDSSYKRIATGENGLIQMVDYRLVSDELGVIFYRIPGSTHPLEDFALLRKEKRKWDVKWTSEGQREWITLDGEIKFLKYDLSCIWVKGTSFTLPLQSIIKPEDEVFRKGDIGTGMYFVGIWEKKGDTYTRITKLPSNAPFYDRLREMIDFSETQPIPYAAVLEFLRRLRNGEDERSAELSSVTVVKKAKKIGLSKTFDSKGNIISFDWGFYSNEEEKKRISMKYASNGTVEFFYRSDPFEQYIVVLKLFDSTLLIPHTHWQIVEIEKINKDKD